MSFHKLPIFPIIDATSPEFKRRTKMEQEVMNASRPAPMGGYAFQEALPFASNLIYVHVVVLILELRGWLGCRLQLRQLLQAYR